MASLVDELYDYLIDNPNRTISYQELYEAIWKVPAYPGCNNTLRVTIHRVRALLNVGNVLYNIKNVGYVYIPRRNK